MVSAMQYRISLKGDLARTLLDADANGAAARRGLADIIELAERTLLYGTDVPFYMQQPEVDEVERDRFYTDKEWALPPPTQRRLVDGDFEMAEGVTILSTPGHTPGHQSVLIESAHVRVVVAGQAVWELREFVEERATESNVFSDEYSDAAIASIRRIKALGPQAVFFSHCASHTTMEGDSTAEQSRSERP